MGALSCLHSAIIYSVTPTCCSLNTSMSSSTMLSVALLHLYAYLILRYLAIVRIVVFDGGRKRRPFDTYKNLLQRRKQFEE